MQSRLRLKLIGRLGWNVLVCDRGSESQLIGKLDHVSLRPWLRLKIMPVELRVNLRSRFRLKINRQAGRRNLSALVALF
ncbi:hypothetical protein TL16_g07727 [Triparma laevis f. inornata]|uniref:Uncharacterized protein n=1 Tax=Triparma laevis f. inornata TaxID=1714386 RepID=A0A9W7EGV3_9STRA|nr:hypothetical protein TL16_g07727 [Triparma laevis f. inornata]